MPRPIRRIVETFIVSLPLLNQDLLGSILAALYRFALTVRTSAGPAPFLRTRASAKPSRRIRSDGSKRRSHFSPGTRGGRKCGYPGASLPDQDRQFGNACFS